MFCDAKMASLLLKRLTEIWVLFFSRELLDIYSSCKDSGEVVEAQNKWMEDLKKKQQAVDGKHFHVNIFIFFIC